MSSHGPWTYRWKRTAEDPDKSVQQQERREGWGRRRVRGSEVGEGLNLSLLPPDMQVISRKGRKGFMG